MQTILARFGLVSLNILVFLLEEGWIIAMVAVFPFWLALLLVTALLSCFAIISSNLSGMSKLPLVLERWVGRQREKARARLAKAMEGAVLVSALTTAIVISPTTSAVMLQMAGVKRKKAYLIDILFSFISGTIWCIIYGGGILILRKIW